MEAERDAVERLLASVADGIPVDWDEALESGPPEGRARLEALRAIAGVADFNRGLQRGGGDAAHPERWGGLLLLERLGTGAHADVFRAWDPALRREVALKLLRAGSGDDEALLAEGRAAAAIRHPHVVTVYGIERHDGRVGLTMELLRGATLEQEVLAHGALAPAAATRLGTEMAGALAAVHAAGLLHRDLKPANVVRDGQGGFVLADFGLGLRVDAARTAPLASGTPMYMAPEVLAGSPAGARSDVHSLGLVLWFALAGRHPYEVKTLAERIAAATAGPTPPLRTLRPEVPAPLAAAIERAIAPDPQARFASARELAAALAGAPAAAARPRASRAPALAVAAVLVAVAAWAAWRAWGPAAKPAAPPAAPPTAAPAAATYDVQAAFVRHADGEAIRLVTGDRVHPGDELSLDVRASRPVWVYVLNQDERGEQFLLFPQPAFDVQNPLPADADVALPGTIAGRPNAWTVTSAGGREHFLVVASPEPVAELEADLARLPAPRAGAPIAYATVGRAATERLRGVGGLTVLPEEPARPAAETGAFARFRALAGRESGVHGVWVRQVVLENPR